MNLARDHDHHYLILSDYGSITRYRHLRGHVSDENGEEPQTTLPRLTSLDRCPDRQNHGPIVPLPGSPPLARAIIESSSRPTSKVISRKASARAPSASCVPSVSRVYDRFSSPITLSKPTMSQDNEIGDGITGVVLPSALLQQAAT
ncbi:hypothetical protein FALBO_9167 [Fusarium albosuccineum]|uniref:Uncharacterized protein n=1 Tax=Fusarium albosuccineum TaxID=1237068 RepID=A0A8H4L8B2_9HYPO|nr:hypothetical protein FALBO_9167 [Fusarium albosuccineum]